ncbi:hypothetical protein A0J61_04940 [Choanephora cucurbitarum]|uniref:Uncharacterized protein n=1 Tax=Choanephora cucurbitarum TaxID=101091 RepID=A0A1C7ND60_9FUNG|nr:hypothetical protein A0J61_04940 [Choanephora cucurbitarum]
MIDTEAFPLTKADPVILIEQKHSSDFLLITFNMRFSLIGISYSENDKVDILRWFFREQQILPILYAKAGYAYPKPRSDKVTTRSET